jgi:hypothetical protein
MADPQVIPQSGYVRIGGYPPGAWILAPDAPVTLGDYHWFGSGRLPASEHDLFGLFVAAKEVDETLF